MIILKSLSSASGSNRFNIFATFKYCSHICNATLAQFVIMRLRNYIGNIAGRVGFFSKLATNMSTAPPIHPGGIASRTPLVSYEELVRLGDISEDVHQRQAVVKLQLLYDQILLFDKTEHPSKNFIETKRATDWFSSLFTSSESDS